MRKNKLYFIQFFMKAQQILANKWGVWLSYSSGNKQQASYEGNLTKLYQLKNWADFAYIWTQSDIKNPNLYFADPFNGQYTKMEIKGQLRKIESINFFKDDIEPTWEYGSNAKGGYYNFSISKQNNQQTVQKVYQTLIMMALGQTLDVSKYLNGVRVVDTSAKKKFRCRFQLWVNYQDHDQNLNMIKIHAESLQKLIEEAGFKLTDIKFFNIGAKIEQLQKNDKANNATK